MPASPTRPTWSSGSTSPATVRRNASAWTMLLSSCEVSTRSYAAAHTGAPMFAVQIVINVPGKLHVAQLREEFMDFCDSLNLDAILEPVKS